MCKIVFAPFLHSLSPHFERNDQLLRKRISFDYIKPELLPVRLQKLKYGPSCISAKYLYGQIPHLGHGRRAFEGFDFVGEAEDVVVGRAISRNATSPAPGMKAKLKQPLAQNAARQLPCRQNLPGEITCP